MSDKLFKAEEWLRYSRHIQLPNFGAEGQTRLKQAHVVIVGMGGLGAPVALYLAAAGVGNFTLFDGDNVELTNLQRQVIYTEDDIGKPKASRAKSHMLALNTSLNINAVCDYFNENHAKNIDKKIDLILDCTDNFDARYLINDICLDLKIPWIYASIHQFSGQCAMFTPDNACFRCVFPAPPHDAPDCNTAGVIGVLPGLLGLFQANEAIKHLGGLPASLDNHLLLFDALSLNQQKIKLAVDSACFCQTGKKETHESIESCTMESTLANEISITDFNKRRQDADVEVLDVRSDTERAAFHIEGEHIPLASITDSNKDWNTNTTYLCYCQSGVRSAEAAKQLVAKGLKAASLSGGLMAWIKSSIK